MFKTFISNLIHAPYFATLCIVLLGVLAVLFSSGAISYFAKGTLTLLIRGAIVAAFFFGTSRAIRFLSLTCPKDKARAIYENPVAGAIMSSANILASAALSLVVFTA